jgi:phosphopantothenoylcysteine decarboxylase/phosphopantothenate--cysteine ligase
MIPRRIVVGVTGGIAAFKTAALVSQLAQAQAEVSVVMTAAAQKFVGPATFAALAGRPVATEIFDPLHPLGAHIQLADSAELLCIAPCSADFLGKMAHGSADDLLSTLYLCFAGPVLVAPAMNDRMWQHPALQRNVRQLQADGVHFVEPQAGWLSCRQQGVGRMAEPAQILAAIEQLLVT